MIKVSVVVPVYNAGEYLAPTVELLCNQTLKDIEIILVDDGSTDKSGKVCDELAEKDNRIKVIHQKNSGVCVARNAGVKAATGEFVTFSDADDIISENLLEVLYNTAVKNNCEMSVVKYATVFPDGKVINDKGSGEVKVYDSRKDAVRAFFEREIFSGVYTKLLSRELALKISFEEGRKINEDRMYVFDALRTAKSCCFKDECLYRYIRREGSSSNSRFEKKHFDCVYFADKMWKIVNEDNELYALADYAKANLMHTYFDMLKLMCLKNADKEYKEKFDEYTEYLRNQKVDICRKYLTRNDFIKWVALKINKGLFKFIIKKFGRT